MYSAEVLSQLRTLNWLSQEARRLPFDSAERHILCVQIEALRARLPLSMLRHHDDRAKRNLPSIAHLDDATCSCCHSALPEGTLHGLVHPGRFGVCPNCGVFLWSAENQELADQTADIIKQAVQPKRRIRRVAGSAHARTDAACVARSDGEAEPAVRATDLISDAANPAALHTRG